MHILTTRGGQLAAIIGPICDNPHCTGCSGFANLNDGNLIDAATIADHDITPDELTAAAADFLQHTGWTQVDPAHRAALAVNGPHG